MTSNDVVTGGAVVAGIVAILFALRPYVLRKKEEPRATEGLAGFQNKEFWEKRFDKLDTAIATIDRISREHRTLTQGEIVGLRDLLVDIDTNLKVALVVTTKGEVKR